jgi:hypothetical protein
VPLFQRALAIRLKILGADDQETKITAITYTSALRVLHRNAEAQELEAKFETENQKPVTANQ